MKHVFFSLFIVSLVSLAFLSGIVALRYEWPLANPVTDGMESAEAWWQRLNSSDETAIGAWNIDNAVANSKIIWDRERAYNGYTLLTMRYSTSVFLLDMKGHAVYRWDMPVHKAWPDSLSIPLAKNKKQIYILAASLFPNGDLLVIFVDHHNTPYGYGMVKMDKDSNVLWTYDQHTHHDLNVSKETGNIYALTQHMVKEPLPDLKDLRYPLLDDSIVILSPQGKELNRLSITEAFRDSPFALMLYHAPKNIALWDILHTNSVMRLEPEIADAFPMFKAGQVLISMRNMNAIAVIDMETRKVVWAYNGLWRAQHAAKFLPNGHILLFDNKGHVTKERPYSRLVEFDPKTLQVIWSYIGNKKLPFYSKAYGRVQRLPNGNTLAIDAFNGRVFEVALDGEIVWDYRIPVHMPPLDKSQRKKTVNCIDICPEEQPYWLDGFDTIQGVIVDAARYAVDDLPFLKSARQ